MTETWREELQAAGLPAPDDPGGAILVLSAHPDDEVLAVGSWLAAQRRRSLTFVTATDGEASHPRSPSHGRDDLRSLRAAELLEALRRLGIEKPVVHRLGLPDGGLQEHGVELRSALEPFVRAADLVLSPFRLDGHGDHDALGRAAAEACGDDVPLWQFPIWTWAWTTPHEADWLPHARTLWSPASSRERKHDAIDAFNTQVRPLSDHPADRAVVEGALLDHALHAPEVVIT
ncbi:PIG-L family deacetylase [Aeromicrobium sp.]|uniref:PIG-L deacetylase family protein n=1 Tax=Aeromicrobium sp. TaxID=1871063 RepID=UPI0030BB17DF